MFITLTFLQGAAVAGLLPDGTVTDPVTNLVWLKNANCFGGEVTFNSALSKTASLANGTCGLKDGSKAGDWRLPTKSELVTRYANKANFTNIQTEGNYWSTTFDDKCDALVVSMKNGQAYNCRTEGHIWPVRAIR